MESIIATPLFLPRGGEFESAAHKPPLGEDGRGFLMAGSLVSKVWKGGFQSLERRLLMGGNGG